MSEHDLNVQIMGALAGFHPVRVENDMAGPGTPDINYTEGWIESKWLDRWPKKFTSIVRVPKYTPQQRAWHVERRNARGRVWVALRVDIDVLIFDAFYAATKLGFVPRSELVNNARLGMIPFEATTFRDFIHYENRRSPYAR